MPRPAKPWYRTSAGAWYVTHEGVKRLLISGPKDSTAAEAMRLFHRLKAGIQATTAPEVGPTVGELIEQFLIHAEAERKASTFAWYRNTLRSFRAAHRDRPASQITPHDLIVWARPYRAANYRRNNIAAVKAVFAWARRMRLIGENPVADTPKPPATRRNAIPSRADVDQVLAETAGTPLGDLLLLLAETGCRLQDARRLTAADIRWDIGVAILAEHKTAGATGRPKVIPLTDRALAMLEARAQTVEGGPLLRNTRGEPWTQSAVSQSLGHVRDRLGFGPELTPHAIRHRYITDATRVLPRNVVAALVGYSSTDMIDRVYDHTEADLTSDTAALRAAASKVSRRRTARRSAGGKGSE